LKVLGERADEGFRARENERRFFGNSLFLVFYTQVSLCYFLLLALFSPACATSLLESRRA